VSRVFRLTPGWEAPWPARPGRVPTDPVGGLLPRAGSPAPSAHGRAPQPRRGGGECPRRTQREDPLCAV